MGAPETAVELSYLGRHGHLKKDHRDMFSNVFEIIYFIKDTGQSEKCGLLHFTVLSKATLPALSHLFSI